MKRCLSWIEVLILGAIDTSNMLKYMDEEVNAKSVRQVAFFTYIRTAVEMGFDSLPLSKKLVCFRNGT